MHQWKISLINKQMQIFLPTKCQQRKKQKYSITGVCVKPSLLLNYNGYFGKRFGNVLAEPWKYSYSLTQ